MRFTNSKYTFTEASSVNSHNLNDKEHITKTNLNVYLGSWYLKENKDCSMLMLFIHKLRKLFSYFEAKNQNVKMKDKQPID